MNLSIIIVSYNTKEFLKKCLESIFESFKVARHQNYRDWEIIVIDNGSTDGTIEEVKGFKTKIIKNKENLGFARAVNQGIRIAEGEVILLLNPDTQVKDGALEKLLEFEEKMRPAIVGLRMLNPDGTVQGSVFNLPTVKRAIEEFWLGKKNHFSKFAPAGDKPIEVEAVSGGAMAISRQVIQKIGLLDERYFMYFEDLDYCRRAKKAGFNIWYLPQAEVIHEHGVSGRNLVPVEDQWRRLIPSSKVYHGFLKHYLINFVIWLSTR